MKAAVLFLITLCALPHIGTAQAPTADAVLKPLYAKARKENKKVLLIFQASWCGWCKKLDASLADSSIKLTIGKGYEIAHLTVYEGAAKKHLENPGALGLLTSLGGADKGLPYWFVLDADGNKLANSEFKPGSNTGCPASAEEVAYFISVLQKTAKLSSDELERIKTRFRKNEQ